MEYTWKHRKIAIDKSDEVGIIYNEDVYNF